MLSTTQENTSPMKGLNHEMERDAVAIIEYNDKFEPRVFGIIFARQN